MFDGQQQPSSPAQPPMTSTLHIYKAPSGRYIISTNELPETRIATFNNVGEYLPAILTKLTPQADKTVSEPLNIILATIHAQISADLQEGWTEHLEPCHKDSALKATDIRKAVTKKLGKTASKELLQPFQDRVCYQYGHATRLLVSPYGQCVTLRA
jgi:hypothetical protein